MNRNELLNRERDRILMQIFQGADNKAKLVTSLMDIDEEIEQLREAEKSFAKS